MATFYAKTPGPEMTKGTQPTGSFYPREEEMNIRRTNRNSHGSTRYRATLAASSLKVTESRTIADLLLRGG